MQRSVFRLTSARLGLSLLAAISVLPWMIFASDPPGPRPRVVPPPIPRELSPEAVAPIAPPLPSGIYHAVDRQGVRLSGLIVSSGNVAFDRISPRGEGPPRVLPPSVRNPELRFEKKQR